MRILFITNNLPPLVDGVGDYTYNIAREFSKNQHEVYIVCRNNPDINASINGIKVFPVINDWKCDCYKPIIKIIKENDIDTVSLQYVPHGFHVKGLPFPLIRLTKEIKKCDVKLFMFCHEVYVGKEKGNPKRNLLSFLMRNITRCIVRQSDDVATSLPVSKKLLQKWVKLGRPVGLIPIPSNIPEEHISAEKLKTFRRKFAEDDEVILAFFCSRKNNISLLRLLLHLDNQRYKIKILIIGKSAMECPADNRVYKTGILPIGEIGRYLRISDLLILPEASESGCSFKSGSLMAALRCGLPVLTNKGRLTDESLMDGYNIVFVDFTREEAFMPVLTELVKDSEKRHRIGTNARETVKQISWESTYEAYLRIIQEK